MNKLKTIGLIIVLTIISTSLSPSTIHGIKKQSILDKIATKKLVISPNYAIDNTLFALTFNTGIFRSTNGGASWQQTISGLPQKDINFEDDLTISPAFTNDHTILVTVLGDHPGIFRSQNSGSSWQNINSKSASIEKLAFSPNYAADKTVLGISYESVFKSINAGVSWSKLKVVSDLVDIRISPNFANDNTVFVYGYSPGAYRSTDGGQSWTAITLQYSGQDDPIQSLAISPSYSTDNTVFISTNERNFKSTDGGQNFNVITTNLPVSNATMIDFIMSPNFALDQTMFAQVNFSFANGIYKSTDGGINWTLVKNITYDDRLDSVVISPNFTNDKTLFASSVDTTIFKSTDAGNTWVKANSGLSKKTTILSVKVKPKVIKLGSKVLISGRLRSLKKGLSRQIVYIGTGSVRTNKRGFFKLKLKLTKTAVFEVTYLGNYTYKSASKKIKVVVKK